MHHHEQRCRGDQADRVKILHGVIQQHFGKIRIGAMAAHAGKNRFIAASRRERHDEAYGVAYGFQTTIFPIRDGIAVPRSGQSRGLW